MSLKFKQHLVFLCIISFVALPIQMYSQNKPDCDEILRYGLFDYSNTVDTSTFINNLLKIYSYQNIKTYNEAKNVSFNSSVTIPIEQLLVQNDINYLNTRSQNSTFSESLYDYYQNNVEVKRRFSQVLKTANKDIIKAWSECKQQNQSGLKCWIIPAQSNRLYYLNVQYPLPLNLNADAEIVKVLYNKNEFQFNEPIEHKFVRINGSVVPFQGTLKKAAKNGFDVKLTVRYNNSDNFCTTGIKPISAIRPSPVPAATLRKIIIKPAKDFIPEKSLNIGINPAGPYGSTVVYNQAPGDPPNIAAYEVKFEHGGKYDFIITCAAKDARPFAVFLNNQLINPAVLTSATGGWELNYQQGIRVGTIEVEKGKNDIRLERSNSFPHILQLSFTPIDQ